jgi:peptidoglycan hydrolase-like protein with peptidoglycan-binding domain
MAHTHRKTVCASALFAVILFVSGPASAQLEIGGQAFDSGSPPAGDEGSLTGMIQRDLVALGYDPGSISGEMDVNTAIAISKYQAENNMAVTGEASPQLAGILSAQADALRGGTAQQRSAANQTAPGLDAAPTSDADPTCVREVAAETADTSRRLGRLIGRLGGRRASQELSEVAAVAADTAAVADAVGNCEPAN